MIKTKYWAIKKWEWIVENWDYRKEYFRNERAMHVAIPRLNDFASSCSYCEERRHFSICGSCKLAGEGKFGGCCEGLWDAWFDRASDNRSGKVQAKRVLAYIKENG